MPNSPSKHKVRLSVEQRSELERMVRQQSIGVAKKRWANVLLLSDENQLGGARRDVDIAEELGLSLRQLSRIRKKYVDLGFEASLDRKQRFDAGTPKILVGKAEAHLVTLCCSEAPEGHERWTLQLLCDELARLEVVTSVCPETVRQALKKMI